MLHQSVPTKKSRHLTNTLIKSPIEKRERKYKEVITLSDVSPPFKIDPMPDIAGSLPTAHAALEKEECHNSDSDWFNNSSDSPCIWNESKEIKLKVEEKPEEPAPKKEVVVNDGNEDIKKAIELAKRKYNIENKRPRNQSTDKLSSESNSRLIETKKKFIKDAQSSSNNSAIFSPNSSHSSKEEHKDRISKECLTNHKELISTTARDNSAIKEHPIKEIAPKEHIAVKEPVSVKVTQKEIPLPKEVQSAVKEQPIKEFTPHVKDIFVKEQKQKATIIEIPIPREVKIAPKLPSKATLGELKAELFKCESYIAEEMSAHIGFQKLYQKANFKELSSRTLFDVLAEGFTLKQCLEQKYNHNKELYMEVEKFIDRHLSHVKRVNIISYYLISIIKIFVKINHSNIKHSPSGLLKYISVSEPNKNKPENTLPHHRKLIELQEWLINLYEQISNFLNKATTLSNEEKLSISTFAKTNPLLAKSSYIEGVCREMIQIIDRRGLLDLSIY